MANTNHYSAYSKVMALTGQLSTTSWQLHSAQSSAITFDFPFSILKTLSQRDAHVPQPMQRSSFTFGFGIFFILNELVLFD